MTGEKHTTIENLAALYAVAWGSFVINPLTDTFARNPKLYEPMREIVGYEEFWGALFIICGAASLLCVYKGCRHHAAVITGFAFISFAVLFITGDLTSPAWVLYGLIGVFNLIHWRSLKWKLTKVSSG